MKQSGAHRQEGQRGLRTGRAQRDAGVGKGLRVHVGQQYSKRRVEYQSIRGVEGR